MIIDCGYKKGSYCRCYDKEIEEEGTCDICHNKIEVYTDKDKRIMLYQAFSYATAINKKKSTIGVVHMRFVYGHDSAVVDDFDSIYYHGFNIWLLLHKKYKYLNASDIIESFYDMQFMNMKIPKRIRREARRLIAKCEREQPWWYERRVNVKAMEQTTE